VDQKKEKDDQWQHYKLDEPKKIQKNVARMIALNSESICLTA
jgi:hypothetical protein